MITAAVISPKVKEAGTWWYMHWVSPTHTMQLLLQIQGRSGHTGNMGSNRVFWHSRCYSSENKGDKHSKMCVLGMAWLQHAAAPSVIGQVRSGRRYRETFLPPVATGTLELLTCGTQQMTFTSPYAESSRNMSFTYPNWHSTWESPVWALASTP